eukprot:TRINITY_DN2147_c0_g1_i1.p1 TRINITY_DN2147_c0_g1~~TRINITY_DN2147_c0_g1_i1.p1  ORF type:complete len:455 (-),score=95.00 TRINITY_DN2147_c0_g1_i1:58-1422(-)
MASPRRNPENVGILAMDVYIPKNVVNQTALEIFDGVESGKYTKGLGQTNMAFVNDREDIVSISLTAVQNFFEKYNVKPSDIGRLEVGTETIIDKSKSVKSYLMELFAKDGNYNVEGVDTMNACYGGTNALFNSINWVESKSWDGRLALVVAADIAVYAAGNARPTGGCSAVVMLIGPDAPLTIECGIRGSHVEHVWDFYKPRLDVEYPTVDGQLSIQCYLKALDSCYDIYSNKFRQAHGNDFSLKTAEYFVFHSPYNGLVRKSVGRLMFNDFLRNPDAPEWKGVQKYKNQQRSESYFNRGIATDFQKLSVPIYNEKVAPSTLLPTELGNSYCASLYTGLISLIDAKGDDLVGKRVVLFSYGSGMAATMFSVVVRKSVDFIKKTSRVSQRLTERRFVDPKVFAQTLDLREKRVTECKYVPEGSLDDLFPGTFYLEKIDEKYRRYYKRLPKAIAKL